MEFKKDFQVSIPSAFYLEYREGERTMKIEMDFRDWIPLLSYRSIHSWQAPFEGEPISDLKKQQIMENIISYLNDVRQFRFEVDGGVIIESKKFRV